MQSYCKSLSVCIPELCHRPSQQAKCATGLLQCDDQTCIQNKCLALVLSKEREKQLEVSEAEDSSDLNRVKRQEMTEGDFDEDDDDDDDDSFISCPRGTAFCLETYRCAPTCAGEDLGQLNDDDGDIFELEEEEDDDDNDDDYMTCPPGTVFCMSEMRCQAMCGREEAEGLEEFEEEEELVCPAGQVFCMQVMACVSNCGFFDQKKEQEKGDGNKIEIEVTCPDGEVSVSAKTVFVTSELSVSGVLYELQPLYPQLHVL